MKYKIGDKVKIKSLEWYGSMVNGSRGHINFENNTFNGTMADYCGKYAIIKKIGKDCYYFDIDNQRWCWYDWMLEDVQTISDQLKEKRFHAACSAMNGILSTEYSKLIPNDKIIQMSYMLADELLKQGGFTE